MPCLIEFVKKHRLTVCGKENERGSQRARVFQLPNGVTVQLIYSDVKSVASKPGETG
jgi:hypothetical protein